MKIKQLINNELVLGDGPKEKIINPFNSEIITEPWVATIKIEFESENNGIAQRRHHQICYK